MKIELMDFQADAVKKLMGELDWAQSEIKAAGKNQVIIFSAPTGSGKTIMMSDLIQRFLRKNKNGSVLWMSDSPQLNVQSLEKLSDYLASTPDATGIVPKEINNNFQAEKFDPQKVYFLNIQKLGKGTKLIDRGDSRQYTILDTIKNTIESCREVFLLIIDEAHRGMQSYGDRETIIQQLISTGIDLCPPVPLVIGMTATPKRFEKYLKSTKDNGENGIRERPVPVKPEDVREAGLIKGEIVLAHLGKKVHASDALLKEATEKWEEFREKWKNYCDIQGSTVDPVRPLMVVQVEDGGKTSISKTDILKQIRVINKTLKTPLLEKQFAHCFNIAEKDKSLEVNGKELRYVEPAKISGDETVEVVFFKNALGTGWDCPRAEVIFSHRKSNDPVNIAQLVGRMVRSPLARRIDADEDLNRVYLYLPQYDQDNLAEVITALTEMDGSAYSKENVLQKDRIGQFGRNPKIKEKELNACMRVLGDRPTYVGYRGRGENQPNQIKRLIKFATLLKTTGIYRGDPLKVANDALIGVINKEMEKYEDSDKFKSQFYQSAVVEMRESIILTGTKDQKIDSSSPENLKLSSADIGQNFDWAGKQLGQNIHKVWLRSLNIVQNDEKLVKMKRKFIALYQMDPTNIKLELEDAAEKICKKWLKKYEVEDLDSDKYRNTFNEIQSMTTAPVPTRMNRLPTEGISVRTGNDKGTFPKRKKHIYADDNGEFPANLNKLEQQTLDEELESAKTLAWFRNEPKKPYSLSIPVGNGSNPRPMYPDFLIFRKNGKGDPIVDILEPHAIPQKSNLGLGDSLEKAKAMANFAKLHSNGFGKNTSSKSSFAGYGRIQMIREGKGGTGKVQRLEMSKAEVIKKVLDANKLRDLDQIFNEQGFYA